MTNFSSCFTALFTFTFFTALLFDHAQAVTFSKSPSAHRSHRAYQRRPQPPSPATPPTTDTIDKRNSSSDDALLPGPFDGTSGGCCFPSIGFEMPGEVPGDLQDWWCGYDEEYAFMGFSYEVSQCQSRKQLRREFKDIRETFDGRYVRMYGACDREGFYDDVIEAAWEAGVGVHALIWFGFDGTNEWKTRRDNLLKTLHSNPKAPYVTRAIQFGSEPLYDWVLDPWDLPLEILALKASLAPLYIPVTISEMAYGYQEHNNAWPVMNAVDIIDAHMLPFFSQRAATAKEAWPLVLADLDWFQEHGQGKKIYLSQNGWPSETYPGVKANSANAVADIPNEKNYFKLLDSKCSYFKEESIGWFAHIYSDSQEPGYGIYDVSGKLKFKFEPQTEC